MSNNYFKITGKTDLGKIHHEFFPFTDSDRVGTSAAYVEAVRAASKKHVLSVWRPVHLDGAWRNAQLIGV